MGHEAKWEYFVVMYGRYREAERGERQRLLDEFCANCRLSPQACHPLAQPFAAGEATGAATAGAQAEYGAKTVSMLDAGLGSGRLSLVGAAEGSAAGVDALDSPPLPAESGDERQLLRISARRSTVCGGEKRQLRRRLYGRTKPGTLLKHQIPIKTDNWE